MSSKKEMTGYDFVTNEKLKLFEPDIIIVDDVPLTMKNTGVDDHQIRSRSSSSSSIDVDGKAILKKSESDLHLDRNSVASSSNKTNSQSVVIEKLFDSNFGFIHRPPDYNPNRRSSTPGVMSTDTSATTQLVQRCVIITRDDNGYGLTVSGFNPVFVQSVKEDGAAARAGVRQGDRIIKVNGTLVREANHMDVVKMISNSGTYVALTLYGHTPTSSSNSNTTSTMNNFPTVRHSFATRLHQQSTESLQSSTTPEFRTKRAMTTIGEKCKEPEPEPGDMSRPKSQEEKQAEWRRKREKIICQMLDDEKKSLEDLLVESKRNPTAKNRQSVESAQKRIANLEKQLTDFKMTSSAETIVSSAITTNGTVTAPLTVPAPANGSAVRVSLSAAQMSTISVEESDTEVEPHHQQPAKVDVDGGPFSSFAELKTRLAHLAVFMHYLLSNSDPASLLFFLITDLYQSSSGKDLRKWAYEIYSTFLIPTAPLRISSIDNNIHQEIENVLSDQNQFDVEDVMKKIFGKARQKAWDEINELLSDFRSKRTLGLGNVFGENMLQGVSAGDSNKERKIADNLLTRHIETYFSGTIDYEQMPDRSQALASSLCTVLKMFGIKPVNSVHEKLMEKCPLYVAKEKKGLAFMSKLSKQAVTLKAHQFLLSPILSSARCYQCQLVIWGISPQAYCCSECHNVIHKRCLSALEDACYGVSKLRPAGRVPSPRPSVNEQGNRDESSKPVTQPLTVPGTNSVNVDHTDKSVKNSDDLEGSKSTDSSKGKDWATSKSAPTESVCTMHTARTAPGNIARSRSMNKEGHKRTGSDTAATATSETDKSPTSDAKKSKKKRTISKSSSSSSISRTSLPDSPGGGLPSGPSAGDEEGTGGETLATSDSDLEVDNEVPRLEDVLPWDIVKLLKPKEKKRQEVINELFHTERTHVRNLKVLRKLFYEPLVTSQSKEFVKLLFANIEDVLNLHAKINNCMKAVTKRNKLVGDIGDLMLAYFDGDAGKKFKKIAATFCHGQQYALEALKVRRKKDQKLAQFLQEAECCAICRKLQLKDMLPMEMQRLTKYPLLLETVAKYTPEPSEELDKLKRCVECSKEILAAVNTAKRNSENSRRLQELQKRLDTKEFDRLAHTVGKEYKNLDLRRYTLIHDGHLTWRLGKNKAVDLHVVLLEELILLLTKNSDGQRLSLKFHNINLATGKEDAKSTHCPLLKLSNLIAKNVATDNKAFFIVSTSAHGPQIYEFVTQTTSDKKKWFKLITDQIDICKQKEAPPPVVTESTAVLQPKTEDSITSINMPVAQPDPHVLKINTTGITEPAGQEEEQTLTERAALVNQPKLINPSEVLISQPTVLEHAEPVLTPLEMLKRKDELIFRCLLDKQKILTQLCNLPHDDDAPGDISMEIKGNKEARELALAAIVQTNRILEAINEGMKTKQEPDAVTQSGSNISYVTAEQPAVSCAALTRIAAPLMKHLTALLHSLQLMEEDLKRVQIELRRCKSLASASSAVATAAKTKVVEEKKPPPKTESSLHDEIVAICDVASCLTTDIDDYLRPSTQIPKLSVYAVSSEETLTESKVQTPMAKSPSSPIVVASDWILLGKSSPSFQSQISSSEPAKSLSLSSSSYKVSGSSFSDATISSPEVICGEENNQKHEVADSSQNELETVGEENIQDLKKLDSKNVDDDDPKRQKRKQKRQRHSALIGFSDSRQTSSDLEDNHGSALSSGIGSTAARKSSSASPIHKEYSS